MHFRRFFLGAVASVPMLAMMAGAAHAQAMAPAAAKSFIQQSGDKLVAIVNGDGTQRQKATELRDLVNQIVAVDQVGDYVLGRYNHVATPAQKQQFLTLFHQLLSYNITYQIKAYKGVSFTVNKATQQGNDVLVDTTVTAPDKSPADVGWVVEQDKGQPKIIDVIVAGTSLRITTRNDYAGVITDNGGQVSALLSAMQNQITKISSSQ
ncbi:MlaC/ttg2D family ABC transporter substrate-binding protein [Acidocella aminolytica]|jgi:phospholipid transport system substrate-binding protein|uniref:ABC transporter toluene transporter auxiliary component n=1 Tax=Acidocella aminolytica 101 = DSM 11237 TaxID=1120923 RepID=A0A0D6PDB6_9PROT|nr:ABC transporter substrate-binding protein [Acidocella aminolytica]GAN79745.1 ABC transporter toluene transporter auxiliary component [Acidocella aminolytica 101 = DSM 11237]GBQ35595.1 toluene tolerance family protein [Acidocella aminolytica 101 = DSM 11237]SHE75614.1 phospholipid transport system substrate-binding protein [Acidocella aminolytica 101 = DSM 11237]